MDFTTLLMTVSMVAIASAAFPGWPAYDSLFPGFPSPMSSVIRLSKEEDKALCNYTDAIQRLLISKEMPLMRFGHMASPPPIPGMPTFPQNFPFFQFPTMPTFPKMPSVADIATRVPTNGGSFTGVVISSKSEMKRKDDGTIVKEGGSTILTNTDGVINIKQTGNNPPPIPTKRQTVQNEFDFNDQKIKPSNPNQFKNFDHFTKFDDFNNFDFRQTFATIDPEKIETYVPGADERFEGHSIRSHTFSSNNNGQVKEGGSSTKIDNDNGNVKKIKAAFNSDGTQP